MRTTKLRLLGGALVMAVAVAGCNNEEGGGSATTETTKAPKYDAAKGVESPAVDLRTELTSLLHEHVLLTGIAASNQLAGQDPAPAASVLEQNSVALADVFTRQYGAAAGEGVLALLRRQVAANLEFAAASAAGPDKARVDKAKADLEAVATELATLLNGANKQLVVDDFQEAMESFQRTTQTALTAAAKKDPEAAAKLREAAAAGSQPAAVLSGAIAKDKGKDLAGKVDSIGAVMRTSLATKLQEHTYLAGLTAATAVGGGDVAPVTKALDEASLGISRAIGSVYGDEPGRQFLRLWREHDRHLVAFTQAAAAGDQAGMDRARAALAALGDRVAAFLAGANPRLDERAVATDQRGRIAGVLAAIQAQAAKDPTQVGKLREAARRAPDSARLLALAFAQQFPTKFG